MEDLVVTSYTGESLAAARLKLNHDVETLLSGDDKPEGVVALGEAITISTDYADQCLQKGNEETAAMFIRMGHVLNQLGKHVDSFTRSFAHGFAQELQRDAKALISNPIGFVQEEFVNLGNGIKQATLLTLRFGAVCHRIMSSEPAQAERLIKTYTRRIGEKLTTLSQHLTAEKLGDLAGRFAGSSVFRRYRTRILGTMAGAPEIAHLAEPAEVLAAAVKTNAGAKLAEKSGSKKVNKSIAQLEKDPSRVSASKDLVKEVEKAASEVGTLSKGVIKHATNGHLVECIKQQIPFRLSKYPRKVVEEMLAKDSFFNKNWSKEQVEKAVKIAFDNAVKAGVKNGSHSMDVFGETVTVYLNEQGKLRTAYGAYKYKLSDFGY